MSLFRAVGASGGTPVSGSVQNVANTNYMTFERPVGIDYQVPVGKTLKITRILFTEGTAGGTVTVGYGDTGVAAGAAAPTNPVYLIGTTANSVLTGAVANTLYGVDIYAEVPTGKYPFAYAQGSLTGAFFIGVEE